jgi:hypothetical protein
VVDRKLVSLMDLVESLTVPARQSFTEGHLLRLFGRMPPKTVNLTSLFLAFALKESGKLCLDKKLGQDKDLGHFYQGEVTSRGTRKVSLDSVWTSTKSIRGNNISV